MRGVEPPHGRCRAAWTITGRGRERDDNSSPVMAIQRARSHPEVWGYAQLCNPGTVTRGPRHCVVVTMEGDVS